ncbi:hypothetical protein FQN54_003813 [Arachnomyces sp. PD_36]|nr:hypothetical protein FQN54_003813 [Arachnomyces sp. PD_36]
MAPLLRDPDAHDYFRALWSKEELGRGQRLHKHSIWKNAHVTPQNIQHRRLHRDQFEKAVDSEKKFADLDLKGYCHSLDLFAIFLDKDQVDVLFLKNSKAQELFPQSDQIETLTENDSLIHDLEQYEASIE